MYPGEIPHFRGYPSSDSLNLLARLVAEGVIRAEPPLFSEYTPAGLLIRLQHGEGFMGIKVQDYTGTPSFDNIATLQTKYFALTSPATGQVLLVPQDAATGVPGIINLAAQHFGSGIKSADGFWSKGIYYVGPLNRPGVTGTLLDGTKVEGGVVWFIPSGASGSGSGSGSGASGSGGGSGSGGVPWTSGNAYSYQAQIVEQVCPVYEDDPSLWKTDSFGGDVSGTYDNLSVIRLRGRGISTTAPTSGQALVWDGTNWTPANVSGVPVGAVAAFLNTVPSDWLELVGGTANRTTDANLFAYTGTLYGAGDGSTTFGIPDARGRTLIGAGTGSGLTLRSLAASLGAESVALTSANNGSHTHNPLSAQRFSVCNVGGTQVWQVNGVGGFMSAVGLDTTTASSGSGTAHDNMQPSLVIRWAVKR